jgi:hypothetical protein
MSRYGGGGDYPPRAPERWDRSRFEAASRRDAPPVMERDTYEEVDYHRRPRERTPPPRPREDERYVLREEERYDYRPRREYYYEEPERDPYQGALVHRPREERSSRDERDIEIDISRREYDRYEPKRREARPAFVRRQSSLDTHDRRPMPRYGDRPTEETVFMPSAGRRRSSARWEDYEDVKVADPAYYGDDNFRGYREREIERFRRRRSPSPGSDGTEVVEEKEEIIEKEFPRKGKTKMPARLVNKRAIIQLGYNFEEEVCFYWREIDSG